MKTLLVTIAAAMLLSVLVSVGTAGPVHWVSGDGTVEYGGTLNTHSFKAQIDADGNASGQAEFKLRHIDTIVQVEVDCLTVVGNEAWVGGTVTRSSNPAQVALGLQILFRVQDNGEGFGQTPDLTSQLVWGSVPSCNTTPPLGLNEWTHGNVRIE